MMLLVCTVFRTYAGIFRVRSVDLYLIADAVCWWNLRGVKVPLVSFCGIRIRLLINRFNEGREFAVG